MRRSLTVLFLAGCAGSSSVPPPVVVPEPPRRVEPKPEPPPTPRNHFFSTEPPGDRAPILLPIELPRVHSQSAIWGSTGRDHRGRIYFGIAADGDPYLSAHLVEHDPATGRTEDLGGAVENLKRLGLAKPRENQSKIHTKIWQAEDGYLHFASMDEGGENEDGSKLPTFGSHLWRLKPGTRDWEHLAEVREAVIASAVGGRFVFYLGYYGHVLYRWDTAEGRLTGRVAVGSVGGHTTRNIVADGRGHVFVPRVATEKVELVEFDETLREVAVYPLAGYSTAPDSRSHGIVGFAPLADDGFACVTDKGRLYRYTPRATGGALGDLGTIHPHGECYCASLFSFDGASSVAGLGHRTANGEAVWEWLTFDLRTRRATARKVSVPATGTGLLVYGSVTRDDDGRPYVAGRFLTDRASVPAAWRVVP